MMWRSNEDGLTYVSRSPMDIADDAGRPALFVPMIAMRFGY